MWKGQLIKSVAAAAAAEGEEDPIAQFLKEYARNKFERFVHPCRHTSLRGVEVSLPAIPSLMGGHVHMSCVMCHGSWFKVGLRSMIQGHSSRLLMICSVIA